MNVDQLRTLFAYNQWANGRLLDAAAHLNAEDFTRELKASHGSVRGTLVHIVFGEWDWLRLWLGEPAKDIAQREPPPETFPDVATLRSEWVTIIRDQQAFIETLNDERLNAAFSFENFQGEQSEFALADHDAACPQSLVISAATVTTRDQKTTTGDQKIRRTLFSCSAGRWTVRRMSFS